MVAIVLSGCGLGPTYDVVTGTFDGGKMIALSKWVGTNTFACCTNIDAYADVSDQTPGILDISGLQHWRCEGLFRVQPDAAANAGPFESDQDKVMSLPKLVGGFAGPTGTYRVTIELPGLDAKFGHSWKLLGFVYPPGQSYDIYENSSACSPIAQTLGQQRSIADEYLSGLQTRLDGLLPTATRSQVQGLLDQARQAKVSGDDEADAAHRAADYQLAGTMLTAMAQIAGDSVPRWDGSRWVPLSMGDVELIQKYATKAVAILSETGLPAG